MSSWRWEGIEVAVVSPPANGFPRHSHEEFVISANVNGVEDVQLDRDTFEVGVADVTLYNPGQVQACKARLSPRTRWQCISLYVSPATLSTLTDGEAEFRRSVARAPSLRGQVLDVVRLLRAGVPEVDLAERVRDLVVEAHALGSVRGDSLSSAGQRPQGDVAVERVMRRLASSTHEAVSLGALAAELGCSRESVVRRFVRVTGVPPYTWHLQRRLAVGRSLLGQGETPAQVAVQVGFADQAHFHKHFVRAYATTPARFRATI